MNATVETFQMTGHDGAQHEIHVKANGDIHLYTEDTEAGLTAYFTGSSAAELLALLGAAVYRSQYAAEA
jgi:hypothetical protein